MKEGEKKYAELAKKYGLPGLKEVQNELEVHFGAGDFALRAVIRKIAEKLDFYASVIEEILQPDTSSLYAMHETRFFDQHEKKEMYNVYRKIMLMSRQSVEIFLTREEKEEAQFIKNFFGEWPEHKRTLLRFVKKMTASWEIETDIKEELASYLG